MMHPDDPVRKVKLDALITHTHTLVLENYPIAVRITHHKTKW